MWLWLVTLASLTGTVANIHKKRWAFGVWLCTNTIWAASDLSIGAYAQGALQAVYAGLAVWGLVAWRREAK
jgi:hypothetical protein